MIRRPPRSTLDRSSAASDVYKRQALWDQGEPSPTYMYRRGDPLNPGRLVGPGVLSVLTDGKTPFAVAPPWPLSLIHISEPTRPY